MILTLLPNDLSLSLFRYSCELGVKRTTSTFNDVTFTYDDLVINVLKKEVVLIYYIKQHTITRLIFSLVAHFGLDGKERNCR